MRQLNVSNDSERMQHFLLMRSTFIPPSQQQNNIGRIMFAVIKTATVGVTLYDSLPPVRAYRVDTEHCWNIVSLSLGCIAAGVSPSIKHTQNSISIWVILEHGCTKRYPFCLSTPWQTTPKTMLTDVDNNWCAHSFYWAMSYDVGVSYTLWPSHVLSADDWMSVLL